MFASSLEKGTCLAPADVCKTPSPGGPVPVPYPNIGQCAEAKASTCSKKVFIKGMKAFTQKTQIPRTNGDQGGSNNGVVSNKIMKEVKYTKASQKVYFEGPPAVVFGAAVQHNANNAPGAQVAPSQNLVIIKG